MGRSIFRLANGLILVAVIFVPLERFFSSSYAALLEKEFLAGRIYYFVSNVIPGFILVVPVTVMISVLHKFVLLNLHHWVADLPLWARVVGAFVIAEIGAYWGHRWMHEVPAFWRFHIIHHSSEQMDWMVNTRSHPIDIVFMRFCAITSLHPRICSGQFNVG